MNAETLTPKLTIQCVKMILRKDELDQLAREVLGDPSKMYLYAFDSFPDDVNLSEAMEYLKIIEASDEGDFLRKVIKHDQDFLETLAWSKGDDFVNQDTVDTYNDWINEHGTMEALVEHAKTLLGKKLFYTTIQKVKTKTDEELKLTFNQ